MLCNLQMTRNNHVQLNQILNVEDKVALNSLIYIFPYNLETFNRGVQNLVAGPSRRRKPNNKTKKNKINELNDFDEDGLMKTQAWLSI